MIEFIKVKKSYGAVHALRDVSFVARNGEITGILGPNGAGKTTSLRCAATTVVPDEGSVVVDGIDCRDVAGVRARIGVLPHTAGLYGRMSPREHAAYFARLYGVPEAMASQRFSRIVQTLQMEDFADRRADGFSQGQKLKTAIARALIHDPANLILDEPTSGLDVAGTRAMRTVIRGLKEAGKCILFSSHVMQEVTALCDRVVVIAGGQVRAQGTPDELLAQTGKSNLEDAFVAAIGSDEGIS